MKNFILLSFLVLQAVLVFAQEQPRVSQLFNFDWKFRAGDLKEAQLVTYDDDDDWRVLDLPHDFQIEQTWDESAGNCDVLSTNNKFHSPIPFAVYFG